MNIENSSLVFHVMYLFIHFVHSSAMWHELEQQSQCSRVYNVICHSGEDLWTPLERDTLHTVVYAC